MNSAKIHTPVGILGLVEQDNQITQLSWHGENSGVRSAVLKQGLEQLEAYFAGELDQFDLPLAPKGTPFQQQVYRAMLAIPKGETLTYGDIAKALDCPAQPIGQACGSNPIPVIIPCHRVVGAANLGGFSGFGGVEMKIKLLQHEQAYSLLI
ncbi:MAG: methylated-DNA--[protein]-cysteine S-methyltransferase [Rhodobacteraceae bacterium]|nr:methylated-DNA--[protein]-cysteine S-methyltransferase [Paracoccaceae bacterium]